MVDTKEGQELRAYAPLNDKTNGTRADIVAAVAEGIILGKHDGAFTEAWVDRKRPKKSRQGVPPVPKSVFHDAANIAKFKRMWTTEVPNKLIMREFGISHTQVCYWRDKLNLEPRHNFRGQKKDKQIHVTFTANDKRKIDAHIRGKHRSYAAYIRLLIKRDLARSVL